MSGYALEVDDTVGRRDDHWKAASNLMRQAVRTAGRRCLACGGRLYGAEGTGRLYCDDTCRSRFHRRRERLRAFLRERDAPCGLCGSDV